MKGGQIVRPPFMSNGAGVHRGTAIETDHQGRRGGCRLPNQRRSGHRRGDRGAVAQTPPGQGQSAERRPAGGDTQGADAGALAPRHLGSYRLLARVVAPIRACVGIRSQAGRSPAPLRFDDVHLRGQPRARPGCPPHPGSLRPRAGRHGEPSLHHRKAQPGDHRRDQRLPATRPGQGLGRRVQRHCRRHPGRHADRQPPSRVPHPVWRLRWDRVPPHRR